MEILFNYYDESIGMGFVDNDNDGERSMKELGEELFDKVHKTLIDKLYK